MDKFSTGFASHWDRLVDWQKRWDGDSELVYLFVLEILGSFSDQKVLDVAVGTGVDMAYMLQQGVDCSGSDVSHSMLGVARSNLEALGFNDFILLYSAWSDLPNLNSRWNVLLCLGNSFACCVDKSERQRSFDGFASSLEVGGLLILDHRDYMQVVKADSEPLSGVGLYYGDKVRIERTESKNGDFNYIFDAGSQYSLEMRPVYLEELKKYAAISGLEWVDTRTRAGSHFVHCFRKKAI